ncbi:MAG: 4Fe-4S dicluster domain-containing protein [Desulfitobacteriaceae bacterium]
MITEKMRVTAKELLENGNVATVIGWEKGTFWYNSTPVFISKPEQVDRLVFDEFCANNLAKYLMDYNHTEGKVAIFVKGCDALAVNRLLQDQQIKRENIFLIGLPCPGMKELPKSAAPQDPKELPALKKCRECTKPNPIVYDVLLGDLVPEKENPARFSAVEVLEAKSVDEKYEYWEKMHSQCIRCYACRNVCPACNCRECCFDANGLNWLGKQNNIPENQMFAMTRGMHVAGRCIECGECERVCPMGLPIMEVNRKLIKDINELFGPYEAGLKLEDSPPLSRYELHDPEKFM